MGESAVKSHAKSRKHIDLHSTRSYFNDKITPESIHQQQHSPSLSAASSTSNIGNIKSHVVENDVLDPEILWTLRTVKNHGSYEANWTLKKCFIACSSIVPSHQNFCAEKKNCILCGIWHRTLFGKSLARKFKQKEFCVAI
ncbi:hypothetical protein AVEN_62701-1 [Araneus ventricosus]|uniref:Uncharacterized protein n=1 Tax=Araneus ventricosus TaxID=182803 RepID=A0A4Y2FIK7_ARAVE|nr:hypothetical protein AVEN_62701-1 [Araneus ventricosus]